MCDKDAKKKLYDHIMHAVNKIEIEEETKNILSIAWNCQIFGIFVFVFNLLINFNRIYISNAKEI